MFTKVKDKVIIKVTKHNEIKTLNTKHVNTTDELSLTLHRAGGCGGDVVLSCGPAIDAHNVVYRRNLLRLRQSRFARTNPGALVVF